MANDDSTRRAFVTLAGSAVLAGTAGGVAGAPTGGPDRRSSRTRPPMVAGDLAWDSYTILDGTEHRTRVYVREADASGPTVMVVGGVHGNEVSGYETAEEVVDWLVESGTLVVLPEANTVAIERGRRVGEDDVDLNRQFPVGREPTTEVARAIWEAVVRRFEPDTLVDLHRSVGIYDPDADPPFEDGVGQAIFHVPTDAAERRAEAAAASLNEHAVPDSRPEYDFTPVAMGVEQETDGLLVEKAHLDLGTTSFLVEVTSDGLPFETRVEWTERAARRLVDLELGGSTEEPAARLETAPANVT